MKATQETAETWCPVPEFEGRYEVSDQGRVRSLDMRIGAGSPTGTRLLRGRVLKQYADQGYARVVLTVNGKRHMRTVHRLVAAAFLGPRPDGMETCHNNGDSLDNRVENLRYDTHSENQLDVVRHGRHNAAKRTHCKHGHEYTPENIYRRPGTRARLCRECRRAAQRKAA